MFNLENSPLELIHTLHTRLNRLVVKLYISFHFAKSALDLLISHNRFVLPIYEDQCCLPKKGKEKAKRKRKEEKEK